MSARRNPLPLTGKILLLAGAGLILFGCGLLLGAGVGAVLVRPLSLRSPSGPAGSALNHPAPLGTAVVAGDLEIRGCNYLPHPSPQLLSQAQVLFQPAIVGV